MENAELKKRGKKKEISGLYNSDNPEFKNLLYYLCTEHPEVLLIPEAPLKDINKINGMNISKIQAGIIIKNIKESFIIFKTLL